jgi:hypothetical protein
MSLPHFLVAVALSVVTMTAVGATTLRAESVRSATAPTRGYSAQDVKPYPPSNWTSYTFKDRGQAVRYDGGVDDTTGFLFRMSIDYGNGAQVHIERPQPVPLALVGPIKMTSTSALTISTSAAAKDFSEILNDEGEQKRAYEDLKRLIANRRGEQLAEEVARRAINSMKDLAMELEAQYVAPAAGRTR